MSVLPKDDVLQTFINSFYLDLCSQYQNYSFTMNLCLGKIVFAL